MVRLTKHLTRLALLAIAATLPQLASAYDFMVNGLCYKKISENTVSVTSKEVNYALESNDFNSVQYGQWWYFGSEDMYSYIGYSNLSGEVVIPESVTYSGKTYTVTAIDWQAFSNCSAVTAVTIPGTVKSIGFMAFNGCTGLNKVNITDLTSWCDIDFQVLYYDNMAEGCFTGQDGHAYKYNYTSNPLYYAHDLYLNDIKIANLVIPSSVARIKGGAFYGCSINSVSIPSSLTKIDLRAFANCTNLTQVHVDDMKAWCELDFETTYLGNYVAYEQYDYDEEGNEVYYWGMNYYDPIYRGDYLSNPLSNHGNLYVNNNMVANLVIPSSVTLIGERTFYYCSGLTSVYSKIRNPQTLSYGHDIFSGDQLSQCPLYVPKGKLEIYSATSPWSAFSNIIEMDPTGDVNDDGTVNVTDYVATARYILEQDPQPFYLEECDFDDNGTISVADLVSVAYTALHYEDDEPMLAPAVGMTENPVLAMAADVDGRDGSYEVVINLSNNVDLTALQMDLDLPAGMTLVNASLSDRASGSHQVAFNQLSNGDYRLLASSPSCKPFAGSEGAVLTLTLAGEPSGDGLIRNIELATPRAASYKVDDIELHFVGTTGVDNMTSATARIYSDGSNIIIDSPASGTAQIVLPNGMSKTVNVTAGHNVYEAPAKGMIIVKMGNSINKLQMK